MTQKIDGYRSSQPLVSTSSKVVGTTTVTDKAPVQESADTRGTDQVTLTDSARSLQKIEEALANAPVVNAGKVDSVKLAVNDGTYTVDSGRVADKMLAFERSLK